MGGTAHSTGNLRLFTLCLFFALGSFEWGYASLFLRLDTLDRGFGRRVAAFSGAFTTCIGASLQASAAGQAALAMMVLGRIICGFGNALLSTSIPIYQRYETIYIGFSVHLAEFYHSEVAPAHQRGGLVVLNHLGMVGGLSSAF